MTLRTKVFLYFLGVSTTMIIVGMIFYVQLSHLMESPATKNIPLSQLSVSSDKNNVINQLLYQQLLVESNLEDYLFTGRKSSLDKYFVNNVLLSQLVDKIKVIDLVLWDRLNTEIIKINSSQAKVLQLLNENKSSNAREFILSDQYIKPIQNFSDSLRYYSFRSSGISSHAIVPAIKLPQNKTVDILHTSVGVILIIFLNVVIISILLAVIFISARAISRPIQLLKNNIDLMANENIDTPIDIKLLDVKGEVGDLARSFAMLINKLRAVTVLRDELLLEIEQRKQIEKTLKRTAFNLQASNLELDQFAYAASHDLRSPLRAIENLAQWIEEDCYLILPEESRKRFDLIKKRVNRLEALISGMLEYSRAGKIVTHPELVSINKLLIEIIDNLAPPPNIKITIESNLPIVMTNKVAITEVFLNLINNAIKYNNKVHGQINIGYSALKDYYQFYVADNGPGIDSEFHTKIFELFQTLQSRDTIESSGMGLAIVKKIVEKVGGRIWVQSALGLKTIFYFTWPKELKQEEQYVVDDNKFL